MTMKVQTFVLFAGLVLLLAGPAAAAMTVSIDSTTAAAGSTAIVPVKVSGASNLAAMDLVVTYDPSVLQFSSADLGAISTNGMVEANSASPGTVKIGLVDTKGISGDGTLVSMNFKVVGGSGTSSQVNPQVSGAWNLDLVDIQTTTSSGTLTVGGGESGGSIPLSMATVLGAVCVSGVLIGLRMRRKE
jgi:hypothetical protein